MKDVRLKTQSSNLVHTHAHLRYCFSLQWTRISSHNRIYSFKSCNKSYKKCSKKKKTWLQE